MSNYIDGFILPVPEKSLNTYQNIAAQVAEIWKEYGALAYFEFLGDELHLEGTRSFIEASQMKEDEKVIFGWVVFPSKKIRDQANQKVPLDPRMEKLVGPLTQGERLIFDAKRMIYGGFELLVQA